MKILVSYDVGQTDDGGARRLRKVAKACKSYGIRVQYSVFECSVSGKELQLLRKRIFDAVDLAHDSIRIYFLGDDDAARTEHHGVRPPLDPDGPLLVD